MVTTTLEDIVAVYQHAPDWLQWAMKTCYFLSLRPGHVELFSLLWTAFNWQRGLVVVRQGKSGIIKTVVAPQTYLTQALQRCTQDTVAGIPYVCHRNGRPVVNYRKGWDLAVKAAGLTHFRMYDIRHVAATTMLALGADLASVSAQLGHTSVTTTGNTYAHVTVGAQQKAAALMPGLDDLAVKNPV